MKFVFCLFLFLNSMAVMASSTDISGTATLSKEAEKLVTSKGVLFVIAKKAGAPAQGTPPLAVLRIPQPQFPQAFSIGSSHLMMGGQFEGPMSITVRYSESGDAMDKSGPEGSSSSPVKPGTQNLKIELKSKKK